MNNVTIHIAKPEDAQSLLQVYAPYVTDTAISFEWTVPTVEQFRRRIEDITQKYPYLVARRGSEVLGYAYTHPFVGRAAYDWSAETTIYLRTDQRSKGLGKRLYTALEELSLAQNLCALEACIGEPEREDEHLTCNSMDFHAHMGYRLVGRFEKSGRKFGRWYNMVWMEKVIRPHPEQPEPVIPFPQLEREVLLQAGITL